MTAIRAIDLFAGIGGFHNATAACEAPIDVVAAIEHDKYARRTYEAIHGGDVLSVPADLLAITRTEGEVFLGESVTDDRLRLGRIRDSLPQADLIMGGLPCQPHSLMGNRRGLEDNRGDLVYDTLAVIAALEPTFVLLENVRAMRSVNDGLLFKTIISALESFGYDVDWVELNAADFGIPQVRRRLFIYGSRAGLEPLDFKTVPVASREYPTTWHLLERKVDDRYYLSDRILNTVLKDQHKGYRRKADINRLTARPLTRTMHKMHRASQDNYYSDDFIRGKIDADFSEVRHARIPSRIRRITPREAFRIQGFPEHQIDAALAAGVSDTQLYMQTGNAVPPHLAGAVLNSLTCNWKR